MRFFVFVQSAIKILNIPEIKWVKLLIGGKEVQTLAGHIDLEFPLEADMLLIR